MWIRRWVCLYLLWGLLWPSAALAGGKALIIGIGQAYGRAGIPVISGPARDVDLAVELAGKMGIPSSDMTILKEQDATKEAILDGLDWLSRGAGEQAFLFYSGHGFQVRDENGDEEDGCDEALVPVDCSSPETFILDDRIGECLEQLKGVRVVAIIDSCFSGTINKGLYLWSARSTKYYGKGVPDCGRPVNVKSVSMTEDKAGSRAVVLTAAAQNEVAYGNLGLSGKGSLFTQSLIEALDSQGTSLTFAGLRKEAAKRIRQVCETKKLIPHTPQIYGNPEMFEKTLSWRTGRPVEGLEDARNNEELLELLMNSSKFMVSIRADARDIDIGEQIAFEVASSKEGYLNLVELEPNNRLNVIFPNQFKQSNRVRADQGLSIPCDIGGFRFVAAEPAGQSKIVALVTTEPLNLYENSDVGEKIGAFKSIGQGELWPMKSALTRSVSVQPERSGDKEFGASGITLRVR